MIPSLRSHPNHPQQPISLPYTRFVRGNGYGSGHWLRHSFAGSPLLQTESGSLSFGTTSPPRAAPHPVSRRRSCLRLLSRCSSRDDSDFHWLISYMCIRTSADVPVDTEGQEICLLKETEAPFLSGRAEYAHLSVILNARKNLALAYWYEFVVCRQIFKFDFAAIRKIGFK
jgi:hypothetical protein